MTLVTAQMTLSLDGFYAGPKQVEPLQGTNWMNSAEAVGFMRITRWVIDASAWRERLGFQGGEATTNSDIIAETFAAAGGKNVAVAGGGSLLRQVLKFGLLDELELHSRQ